jgi:hypothetical protein
MIVPGDYGRAEDYYRALLRVRLKRTLYMVEGGGPEVLVAENISLAVAAAIGYCGGPLLERLGSLLKRVLALRAGFCPDCAQPLEEDGPLCPHCQRAGDAEGNGEL